MGSPFQTRSLFNLSHMRSSCNVSLFSVLVSSTSRAPELFFGLPFSEAIDMWSLGCVMGRLISGKPLWRTKYDDDMVGYLLQGQGSSVGGVGSTAKKMNQAVFYIQVALFVQLWGQPADCLLNDGMHAPHFFTKTKNGHWRQKVAPLNF